jgi:hypothetical protein
MSSTLCSPRLIPVVRRCAMHTGYTILFIVLAIILLAVAVKVRVLVAAKRRSGMTGEQFVSALTAKGIPEEIGRAVFTGFHKWGSCISDDFPITPEISLRDFIPWVEYDEVDIIHDVLDQTGRHWPPKELLPCEADWTLADVAKFVADCPRTV